jgi:hypothetical protein
MNIQDILIVNFLKRFFLNYAKISSGIMFNSIGIIRQFKKLYINVYMHDSAFDFAMFILDRDYLVTKLKKKILGNIGLILKHKKRTVFDYLVKKFLSNIKNLIILFVKNKFLTKF